MRNPGIPFFLHFFTPVFLFSQSVSGPIVSSATYFDVSPPFREMVNMPGVKADPAGKEEEIWNFFRSLRIKRKYPEGWEDAVSQFAMGAAGGDSILVNVEGTDNVNTSIPPDTYGDVGPDHYFQVINLSYTIFDKSGDTLLGPVNAGTIFNGLPYANNNGDGIVLYDDQANRWMIGLLSLPDFPAPPYFILIAVSQTPDPTGPWYRWQFQFDDIPDYPKFSVWRDAYYFSCNRFKDPVNFDGIGAAAFDREAMLAGDPSARMVLFKFLQTKSVFSILPADCDGPFPPAGLPGYFAYLDPGFLGIYEFHVNWTDPSASVFGYLDKIPVSPFNSSIPGIPQKGSAVRLDPVSDRLMCRLQFRKLNEYQSMVVNHTVKSGNIAGIRWYELRRNTGPWSLYQQSTYAPDSNHRWMGSMALDAAGNIALGYSVSGDSLYPSVRYTGRMRNDPPGLMTLAERSVMEGGGAQTHYPFSRSRWGDYSSMTVDPANPLNFWYTQQYYPETSDIHWHTRIASFTFAGVLDVNAVSPFTSVCEGQSIQLDVESSGGNGNYSYLWSSIPEGFTSVLKDPLVSPLVPTQYTVTVTSGSQWKSDAIALEITPPPSAYAGVDTVCCRHIPRIPLRGIASNYLSLQWTTGGDGTFQDPYALNTYYYPGPGDREDSIIYLELTAFPQPPCTPVSDVRSIRTDTCSVIPHPITGSFGVNIYPNPAETEFTLEVNAASKNEVCVEMVDPAGIPVITEVLKWVGPEFIRTIRVNSLSPGIYFLRIITENRVAVRKIIKL